MKTVFLRALEASDKEAVLRAAIREPAASLGKLRFEMDVSNFANVPRSPFAYWIGDSLRKIFEELPPFEAEGRSTKQGLATADDFRFVRGWWSVSSRASGRKWISFAKGGQFSPFYSDVHLVVNWHDSGSEIKSNLNERGGVRSNVWMLRDTASNYFLRPGLTWPIKNRFSLKPWPLPTGCIFAHVGSSAFVASDDPEELSALHAVMSSSTFTALARIMAGWNFEVGVIQRTPTVRLTLKDRSILAELARRAWCLKRSLDTHIETSHAFILPALLQTREQTLILRVNARAEIMRAVESELASIQAEIDSRCFDLYGIDDNNRRSIEDGFEGHPDDSVELEEADAEGDANGEINFESSIDAARLAADLVSWAVGVAFGRFDIRYATGMLPVPNAPKPFDEQPVCSLAMLTGGDGLPLTGAPAGYPVSFPESGVLVDDRGDARDLIDAVRRVFDEVFRVSADTWWNEVGSLLAPQERDLRTWLATSFFEHHLKHYSRSRRRAPILWQLAVPSGRYSLWLYAHRLTPDSFFNIQNDVVAPKLSHEENQLASLVRGAGPNPASQVRKEIAAQRAFVEELRAFVDEIKRVAPLWQPMLDDGVAVVMAPLWKLVPQHRVWQKELKSKWNELIAGKYDWTHLAMHLWPERVVPKCATDRSLAIAHGLEEVFWAKGEDEKWKPRPSPTRSTEALIGERTSVAVTAALKALSEGGSGPIRRRSQS